MPQKNKVRLVIDTNILISAIIIKRNSPPYQLVTQWRENKYYLVVSDDQLTEIEKVLKREKIYKKYSISLTEIELFLKELKNAAIILQTTKTKTLPLHSRDKNDDMLLACAIFGECDYLITGDEDLLVLRNSSLLGKLVITTAAEYIATTNK